MTTRTLFPALSKLTSIMVAFVMTFGVLFSFGANNVSAYAASNPSRLAKSDNGNGNSGERLFVEFSYEMYFEDVDRATLFEFMKEIPNDDLWCLCSQTTVIDEGNGSKQLGRTWFQYYTFAGLQDQITYTRVYLKEDEQHSYVGKGIFADIGADYLYSDLPGGGTKLTFNAVYRPNIPVAPEMVFGILEALRQSYETQFITYFGSDGHVDLVRAEASYL